MGSAHPRRVIERETTPVYHDIPTASTAKSGLPLLIYTSFMVHEEPIINTSEECAQSLAEARIDCVETGIMGSQADALCAGEPNSLPRAGS